MQEKLLRSPYFAQMHRLEDQSLLFAFELRIYKDDFAKFGAGKYSQLSVTTKTAIQEYYGLGTAEWAYMETYIKPENFFAHYTELLEDVTEAELRVVGELCDPPDVTRETLMILSH